jgi:WD40 repeat protein
LAVLAGVGRTATAQPVVADGTWRAIPGSGRALSPPVGIFIPAGKDSQYANSIGVVIRGAEDRVYYQTYSLTRERWTGSWRELPVRTSVAPFTFVGAAWDIVVRAPKGGTKLHAINWRTGWTEWVDGGADELAWGTPTETEDGQGRRWSFRRGRRDRVEYRCEPPRETATRPELELQIGHTAVVEAILFSPDGNTLASAGGDTIKLWSALTGALRHSLRGHTEGISSLAFSPDSTLLASGGRDRTIKLWDSRSGRLLRALSGQTAHSAEAVTFSPDGKMLASGGWDLRVRLWDVETGAELRTLAGPQSGGVLALAFSSDGSTLAGVSLSDARELALWLWDARTGELQRMRPLAGHTGHVGRVAFSPDGRTIASGTMDESHSGDLLLWDSETGVLRHRMAGLAGPAVSVAFSPDGRQLASGHANGGWTAHIWDVDTGTLLRTLDHRGGQVTAVAFSPDGDTLASGTNSNTVKLWELRTQTLARSDGVHAVALSPNGKMIATGHRDRAIRFWHAETGVLQRILTGHKYGVSSLVFFPDGRTLATGSWEEGTVRMWDAQTGAELRTLAGASSLIAVSPDGKMLASGSGKEVKVWDPQTGRLERTLTGHTDGVTCVAFSPDGRTIASGGIDSDKTVRVWDLRTGELLHTGTERGRVWELAFSPNGKILASASEGETVTLREAQSGKLLRTLGPAHVNAIEFSPDGKALAAAGNDGKVRLWDPTTGELQRVLTGHSHHLEAVAFSSDGKRLVSAAMDHTVKIWDARSGRLLATLTVLPPRKSEELSADWLAITPEGYYDSSPGAARFIQWRVGEDLFPVEAYERTFRQPDLVREILAGETVPETPQIRRFVEGRAIPPQVGFVRPTDGVAVPGDTVRVTLAVSDDREVSRVAIFVNGRPEHARPIRVGGKPILQGGKPILIGGKPVPTSHREIFEYQATVALPPGERRVLLRAVAYDDETLQGWAEVRLSRALATAASDREEPLGDLHILSVGVSRYRNQRYDLKYAAADADAFARLWKRMEGRLYRRVRLTPLIDDQATTERVQAELSRLISAAQPQDSIALFLSGHGVQAGAGQFYFATHEIDATSPQRMEQTALPWTVFETTLAKVGAKRVFLFLDACHSGSVLGEQQASNERLAEALVKRSGVLVFTSSRGNEVSYEDERLGHGVFTAALVEGIGEGKADLAIGGERDGRIMAEELLAYLRQRVPQMTGNRQTPACPLLADFGEAFLLARRE